MKKKKLPSDRFKKFPIEFERRLFALEIAIRQYRQLGYVGSLLPLLFKCLSYCWCRNFKNL